MNTLRSYLRVFALVALLPVAVTIAINATGFLVMRQTPRSDLFNQQVTRLERSSNAELVMLGDSTLGANINEEMISDVTDQHALSLALTGVWGYGGSLAMLERVLAKHRPSTVILVHAVDIAGRDNADFGYVMASGDRLRNLLNEPDMAGDVWANLTSAKNLKKWGEAWMGGRACAY